MHIKKRDITNLVKNDTLDNNKNKYTNVQLTPNDNPHYEVMAIILETYWNGLTTNLLRTSSYYAIKPSKYCWRHLKDPRKDYIDYSNKCMWC